MLATNPEIGLESQRSVEDDSEHYDDKMEDLDGHRPAVKETQPSRAVPVSRAGSIVDKRQTLSRTVSTQSMILSIVRSRPVPVFTHPLSNVPTTKAQLVDFDGPDDPYRPINWPLHKKITTVLLYGLVTMSASWASASYSPGTRQVAREFNVGKQTATLGTSLFLLGFGAGPLLWAPLSEVYGRRPAVMMPMFVAVCFSFATATAKDLQTVMISRFFGAFFASAPITNTGGVLGDLFDPAHRGIAFAGYSVANFFGPTVGPVVSAAVAQVPSLGWRWTEYLTGILQAVVLLFAFIFVDETYPPALLVQKARQLRHNTGNWALHAKFEEWNVNISQLARKFLIRPVQLLTSPICLLMSLYASFCYGILYMQLGSIPIVFGEVRGWTPLVSLLPFLAMTLGTLVGAAINIINQFEYNKAYHAAGNKAVPEKRLPPMMFGSLVFAAGQFVAAWTAKPGDAPWIVPVIGLFLVGAGFFSIFQATLNYLVDTFTSVAASAIATQTFLRCCFAAGFPLAVTPLYHNIGVGPGGSIFAAFACLMIPVPYVFYTHGKRIRAANKWSKGSVFS